MSVMNPTRTIAAARVGTAAIVGYAALALIQILVLNPLAAAPGRSLVHIYADLQAAGETLGAPYVVTILGLGLLAATTVLVLTSRRPELPVQLIVVGYLVLLALGAAAYLAASFGAGMALADTYGIAGNDHAPWASVLHRQRTRRGRRSRSNNLLSPHRPPTSYRCPRLTSKECMARGRLAVHTCRVRSCFAMARWRTEGRSSGT